MRGNGNAVRVELRGRMTIPRGGIALASPYNRVVRAAQVNGHAAAVGTNGEVLIRGLPATVTLSY
jgi:hypothetical protein